MSHVKPDQETVMPPYPLGTAPEATEASPSPAPPRNGADNGAASGTASTEPGLPGKGGEPHGQRGHDGQAVPNEKKENKDDDPDDRSAAAQRPPSDS